MQIYQHLRASPGTVKTLATMILLESNMIRNANIIYGQINVTFPCLHVHKHEKEREHLPALGQWYAGYDGHLWPFPWHLHIHKDIPPGKLNSIVRHPACETILLKQLKIMHTLQII